MKDYKDLKFLIDGKTYDSIREIPEPLRAVVEQKLSKNTETDLPMKNDEGAPNRWLLFMVSVVFVLWLLLKLGIFTTTVLAK